MRVYLGVFVTQEDEKITEEFHAEELYQAYLEAREHIKQLESLGHVVVGYSLCRK